jgi:hypothetical protein
VTHGSTNGTEFAEMKEKEVRVSVACHSRAKPSEGPSGDTESGEQLGSKGMAENRSPTRPSENERFVTRIEQVQSAKKSFTFRWMHDHRITLLQGRGSAWKPFALSA